MVGVFRQCVVIPGSSHDRLLDSGSSMVSEPCLTQVSDVAHIISLTLHVESETSCDVSIRLAFADAKNQFDQLKLRLRKKSQLQDRILKAAVSIAPGTCNMR